ncbi:MAG TPA: hypothetical protein VJC16_00705 [Candidatus Nanoarchaeia archaeon]|nr:hypothetical protein [Candidatus Nanoarchaeia archaeon]
MESEDQMFLLLSSALRGTVMNILNVLGILLCIVLVGYMIYHRKALFGPAEEESEMPDQEGDKS